MSDHSDISYISDDDDAFHDHHQQQQQEQQRGFTPPQQQRAPGRRPARISHATSLASSAGGEEYLDQSAAATSWQVGSASWCCCLQLHRSACYDGRSLGAEVQWQCKATGACVPNSIQQAQGCNVLLGLIPAQKPNSKPRLQCQRPQAGL